MPWRTMDTAPNDRPILVWFDHGADPYFAPDGKLTDYAANAEGGDYCAGKGHAIAKWSPQIWVSEGHESFNGGYWLPGGWFLFVDGDCAEQVCNALWWEELELPPGVEP